MSLAAGGNRDDALGGATTGGVINPRRLFVSSCFALVATAFSFAVVGDIMNPLKERFILTNQQVGHIGGAPIWGFTLSIFVFGPLCDALGMRLLLRLAFLGHLIAVPCMALASGFWVLFFSALAIGIANGLVEAAGNPLVATVYSDRKTEKMNQFHVWFPGGIVIGGLASYAMDQLEWGSWQPHVWQLKLSLILVPTLIYGALFLGQKFPATERVQSGISFAGMFKATFLRPLFLLLLVCMTMTASLELGPNRWMPAVLSAAGFSGILILVWITGLMAVMRQFAGQFIHRLSPTGMLLIAVIVSGIGLGWLSCAETTAIVFISSTVFALGVSVIWPTMLGFTAEQVPKGGALALALMAGTGALAAGLLTSPQMGRIGDRIGHQRLDREKTTLVLQKVIDTFPTLARESKGETGKDIDTAVAAARAVLDEARAANGTLPPVKTANALRSALQVGGRSAVKPEIEALLGPADNFGGRMSFRYVTVLSVVLTVVFGILHLWHRSVRRRERTIA